MIKLHKKALFISYFFPPSGESGMQRSLKFVKYLPKFGWEPIVLTIREQNYENPRMDYSSLEEVPDFVNVYRTNIVYLLSGLYKISQLIPKNKTGEALLHESLNTSKKIDFSPRIYIKNLLVDLLTIPDKYVGWLLFALFEGMRVIDREKPDVIFSTSPPAVAHLIALILKSLFNIPWIADFRDPWVIYAPSMQNVTKIKRASNFRLENEIVKKADVIIANTEPLRQQFVMKYGNKIPLSKFVTLTNGYDPKDIEAIGNYDQNEAFVISHTGEFYDDIRTPDNFMIALSQLIKEDKIMKNDVKVNLVGSGNYTKERHFNELLHKLGLEGVINTVDFVPHKKSIEYLHNSTALLLLQTSQMANLQIPAKAFEYIGISKPIIAITPDDGATAGLIKKSKTGIVLHPENLDSIKNGILKLYEEYKNKELGKYRNDQAINEYSREKLTETLSELFDSLL